MLDSTPTDRLPQFLRSPFNGETWAVPPDVSAEFVAELERRGFTRVAPTVKGKRTGKEQAHGE